jgi:hypothetical protein
LPLNGESALLGILEAMHSDLPLQADDGAFHWLQQHKRTHQRDR